MDRDRFEADIATLKDRLRARFGVRGTTLRKRLQRVGRRLPKSAHRAGATLIEAQRLMPHPRLRRQVDPARIDAALAEINGHLDAVDPADRRKGLLLGMAGGMVFNLIVIAALVIAVLLWRGLI